jgi:hypothetical protein
MKYSIILGIILFAYLLSGCLGGGVVNMTRLKDQSGVDSSTVCIEREYAFTGSGLRYNITIDGWDAARVGVNEFACFPVKAGNRYIGVEGRTGIGLNLLPKEHYYLKTYWSLIGGVRVLERIDRNTFVSDTAHYTDVSTKNID